MRKAEEIKELFEKGFNCAQSVLFSYGKAFFKEEELALKIASGFGAGISYRGEMCGAVSGALMVIGLHYGYSDMKMDFSKEITFMLTREFMEAFGNRHGSVICNRLIKCEINTPEGLENARKNKVFEKVCPLLLESSSEILDSLMLKYPASKIKND